MLLSRRGRFDLAVPMDDIIRSDPKHFCLQRPWDLTKRLWKKTHPVCDSERLSGGYRVDYRVQVGMQYLRVSMQTCGHPSFGNAAMKPRKTRF